MAETGHEAAVVAEDAAVAIAARLQALDPMSALETGWPGKTDNLGQIEINLSPKCAALWRISTTFA